MSSSFLFFLVIITVAEFFVPQGEALVPENIVRFGIREKGRDGVQTLKAVDDRIKFGYDSLSCFHKI